MTVSALVSALVLLAVGMRGGGGEAACSEPWGTAACASASSFIAPCDPAPASVVVSVVVGTRATSASSLASVALVWASPLLMLLPVAVNGWL